MTRSPRRASRVGVAVLTLLGLAAIVLGSTVVAARAEALLPVIPETVSDGRLILAAAPYPEVEFVVSPGEPTHWMIQTALVGEEQGLLEFQLQKTGELVEHPQGLHVTMEFCDMSWVSFPEAPTCPSGSVVVANATPREDFREPCPRESLGVLREGAPREFLVTLSVADDADTEIVGLPGEVGIGFIVSGDDGPIAVETVGGTSTGGTGSTSGNPAASDAARLAFLPATGGGEAIGWMVTGLVVVGSGLIMLVIARRISRNARRARS
ncbi:hypothetical protein FHX48_000730 [Microbacterium halimionae]|uniref:Uncharacterized protein n=1 Tax=Microbacterium halimionae TaxID=1526413 RepID=A0A7W3JMS5_9MICO|nr:hypothetical protein [Microbacterium halimionae]MBA8815678.1 hypothetical protein [Microbacterium halimionae]NII95724.1 hypothetical protein [Microbacterium halimionae]